MGEILVRALWLAPAIESGVRGLVDGHAWFWTSPAPINFAPSETELWRCRLRSHFECLLSGSASGSCATNF